METVGNWESYELGCGRIIVSTLIYVPMPLLGCPCCSRLLALLCRGGLVLGLARRRCQPLLLLGLARCLSQRAA